MRPSRHTLVAIILRRMMALGVLALAGIGRAMTQLTLGQWLALDVGVDFDVVAMR
jgi:hypothetical protein